MYIYIYVHLLLLLSYILSHMYSYIYTSLPYRQVNTTWTAVVLCYHFAFTAELKDSVLTSILRRVISSQKSDPTRKATYRADRLAKRTYFRSKKMNSLSILNSESYSSFIQCLISSQYPKLVWCICWGCCLPYPVRFFNWSPAPRVGQVPFATAPSGQTHSSKLCSCHRSEPPQKAWLISGDYGS